MYYIVADAIVQTSFLRGVMYSPNNQCTIKNYSTQKKNVSFYVIQNIQNKKNRFQLLWWRNGPVFRVIFTWIVFLGSLNCELFVRSIWWHCILVSVLNTAHHCNSVEKLDHPRFSFNEYFANRLQICIYIMFQRILQSSKQFYTYIVPHHRLCFSHWTYSVSTVNYWLIEFTKDGCTQK